MAEQEIYQQFDLMRGAMLASNLKNVLLPVNSIKYLETKSLIPEDRKLKSILKHEEDLLGELKKTFHYIEENITELKGVYDIFPEHEVNNQVLFQLIIKVDSMQLSNEEWGEFVTRILYRSYESEGKRDGGLYSPESINKLGLQILSPKSGSFYDGTAGVGSFLVSAAEYARDYHLKLFGQEINHNSWALAKLHLLFYNRLDAELVQGDVLRNPAFVEGNHVKKFDYVMMDFPFSLDLSNSKSLENDKYNRFIYGTPPKRNGDMAFSMHGLSSMNNNGKGVLVVSNGTLFRGGMERTIRQNLIAADVIEAVISLPAGLYEETGIPVNLLVLNKNKSQERQGKILFINAESEHQSLKFRKYLNQENMDRIVHVYQEGTEVEMFSVFVENQEIEDANLLCSKYLVDKELETEHLGKVVMLNEENAEYNVDMYPLKQLTSGIYRGMNISSKSVDEGEGEYRLIKLSDVQDGEILVDSLAEVSLKRNSRVDKYLVEQGDVIVSNRGSSIKIAVVPENGGNLLLSHNFLGIKCGIKIDPYYLKAYLESPLGMFHLMSNQAGTSVLTINPKDLEDIPIKVVDYAKQHEIGKGFLNAEKEYRKKIRQAEDERTQELLTLYEKMGIRDSFKILN